MNRLLIEALAALAIAGAAWGLWVHHDRVQQKIGAQAVIDADKAAVDRQKGLDDAKIAAAERTHEAEMAQAGLGYAAALAAIKPRIVRIPAPLSPVPGADHPPDPGRPAGDRAENCQLSSEYQRAIYVLAWRVDELNAEARRVNASLSGAE